MEETSQQEAEPLVQVSPGEQEGEASVGWVAAGGPGAAGGRCG